MIAYLKKKNKRFVHGTRRQNVCSILILLKDIVV